MLNLIFFQPMYIGCNIYKYTVQFGCADVVGNKFDYSFDVTEEYESMKAISLKPARQLQFLILLTCTFLVIRYVNFKLKTGRIKFGLT